MKFNWGQGSTDDFAKDVARVDSTIFLVDPDQVMPLAGIQKGEGPHMEDAICNIRYSGGSCNWNFYKQLCSCCHGGLSCIVFNSLKCLKLYGSKGLFTYDVSQKGGNPDPIN